MDNYSYTICDPADPNIIDKGRIAKEDILPLLLDYPWTEELIKMAVLGEKARYSPSLEFINNAENIAITFSAVESENEYGHEFMVFFRRAKGHFSHIDEQTPEDCTRVLKSFLDNKIEHLESVFNK